MALDGAFLRRTSAYVFSKLMTLQSGKVLVRKREGAIELHITCVDNRSNENAST